MDDKILYVEGHEDAYIGMANLLREGESTPVAVYDAGYIVETLMERDGMDYQKAVEYFEVNMEYAYLGLNSPLFVWVLDDE